MALETADQVLAKNNDQRLHDLHWDIRGPGQVVEKFGDDGKVIGGTTLAMELGWLATNFSRVFRRLDALATKADATAAKVDILAAQPAPVPATVDVDALAAALATKLNASQAEALMAALRTQINK